MTRKEAKAILENDIVGGHVEGNARFMDAFWMAVDALSQEPCDDAISRKAVFNAIEREDKWLLAAKGHNGLTEIAFSGLKARVDALPSVTQKSGKCKNCKYFEYNSVSKVDGIPLIVAHEICNKWGDGCKTSENGYCFLYEPQESEVRNERNSNVRKMR